MVSESDGIYSVTGDGVRWIKQRNLYDQVGILYDMYNAADNQSSEFSR